MARTERDGSLRRRTRFRDPYPRMLIVCEGRVTEKRYFEFIRHTERIPLQLEVVPAGVPETVVRRAKELAAEAEAERDAFDAVWCVFDIDEHVRVPAALDRALALGFRLAVSNPCFELWLLLHFQEQGAAVHRHKAQSLCRKHMPGSEKSPPLDGLMKHFDVAQKRAAQLAQRHARNGTPGGNPSTNVYEAVEHLRGFRRGPG